MKERMTPKSLHGIDPDTISLIFEVFWDSFLNQYMVATVGQYSGKVSNPLTYGDLKQMFPRFADKLIWVFAFADERFDLTYSDVILLKTGEIFVYDEKGNLVKTFNEEEDGMKTIIIEKETVIELEGEDVLLEAGDRVRVVEGYNGWTNWETWVVNLWMDENGVTNIFGERIQNDSNPDIRGWSKIIKEFYEDEAEDALKGRLSSSLWADIINNTLSEVNWTEIAEGIIDSYR